MLEVIGVFYLVGVALALVLLVGIAWYSIYIEKSLVTKKQFLLIPVMGMLSWYTVYCCLAVTITEYQSKNSP